VAPEHLGPHIVLWTMARLADLNRLPRPRLVIRFDLTDQARPNRYWLLLEPTQAEVCVLQPGHPEDLVVTTTAEWLAKWHMGAISLAQAQRQHLIEVAGPSGLVRTLGGLGRSPFASIRPARRPVGARG
jgi:hypothetical protein